MRDLIDCHIHTERCGHATGCVEDYVKAAVESGLAGIAITEHLALPEEIDPGRHLSMSPADLQPYLAEVAEARDRHPEIAIVTGLEVDYLDGREEQTAAAIALARALEHPPSVILGSVHFIRDWAFDDPHHLEEWESRDVDTAWQEYFELWLAAVHSGLFDVMAHPDLVKKFGHFPSFDAIEIYRVCAQAAATSGVRIEVSTAGLRKPVGQLYPGPTLLEEFAAAGVPATVGSDAHEPTEVGYEIPAAYAALAAAGYRTVSFPDGHGGWKELSL